MSIITIQINGSRFRKTAAHASWDVSSDAADAIAFSVDIAGVTLHGVGVYCAHHEQQHNFVCEVSLVRHVHDVVLTIAERTATEETCQNHAVPTTLSLCHTFYALYLQ